MIMKEGRRQPSLQNLLLQYYQNFHLEYNASNLEYDLKCYNMSWSSRYVLYSVTIIMLTHTQDKYWRVSRAFCQIKQNHAFPCIPK